MNKAVLFLCSMYLFSIAVLAQTVNTDSLEKILDKGADVKKEITILFQLSDALYSSNPDRAIRYANRGLNIAQREKSNEDIARFLMYLGKAYSYNNDFKEGNKYLMQSVHTSLVNKNYDISCDASYEIAYNHFFEKRFDSTNYYCKKMLEYANIIENKEQQAKAYYLLALVKRKKKNNQGAYTDLITSLKFYEKSESYRGHAKALNTLGQVCQELGKNEEAISYYNTAIPLYQKTGELNNVALVNYNIGNVLLNTGKFNDAMVSFQNAMQFFDKTSNYEGTANCYNNIGIIYERLSRNDNFKQNQPFYQSALQSYKTALDIREKHGSESDIANSLLNIANIYMRTIIDSLVDKHGINWEAAISKQKIEKSLEPALQLYERSLQIKNKLSDKTGIATILINLGNLYNRSGQTKKALNYLLNAAEINKELGNKPMLLNTYFEISRLQIKLGKNAEARAFLDLGTNLAESQGDKYMMKEFYKIQSEHYENTENYKMSMVYYKKFQELQDEISSDKNFKAIQDINTKYQTEKKDSQIKQQRFTIYAGILFVFLILGIIVLLIKQNKERHKVNLELEKKNHVITEQKQEITDSIKYASLIQTAAMPSYHIANKYFNESFVFFRPRDIVSGDFYWFFEINNKIIVAAVDCTGHGVPGAFMSMLGISTLNNLVSTISEISAGNILNELRNMVIHSLHQTGRSGENKDGMDIALYIYDPEKLEVEFAGANNSLLIIRNGEIIETKANKMPIGIHDRLAEPFTSSIIKVKKNDMLYVYSDGYADQFGGPENKKFMSGKMKKMFAAIAHEPTEKQMQIIEKTNLDWRADFYQVDDMIIIGARV